jgi:hypothetical protein
MQKPHSAVLTVKNTKPDDRKIIAYRAIKSRGVYFPTFHGSTPCWVGIENGFLRVYTPQANPLLAHTNQFTKAMPNSLLKLSKHRRQSWDTINSQSRFKPTGKQEMLLFVS